MSDMDVQRAVAILNRASENGMYDPTKIPESDAAKLEAAEQQVQLCEQFEQVVHQAYPGWDDAQIAQKVPHWPAVSAVLAEAKVLVGANEQDPPAVDVAPSLPEAQVQTVDKSQVGPVQTVWNGDTSGGPSEGTPAQQAEVFDGKASEQPDYVPDPPSSAPVAASPTPDQGDPKNGEVWLDSRGNAWLVVHYSGGQSAEVKNVASGEGTIVPAGFLKKRQQVVTQDDKTEVVEVGEQAEVIAEPTGDADRRLAAEILKASDEALARSVSFPPPTVDVLLPFSTPPAPEPVRQGVEHEQPKESPDDAAVEQEKYEALVESVQERYEPSGMPVPDDLADPPSIDAETFADVDDKTARLLHAKYNALAARAKYLHDVEDATARACDLVRTHHLRRAMAVARKQLGPSATVTEVKIVAEDDPLVIEWSDYARSHSDEARAFKTFFDIYSKHVEVLSRDWTMREAQVR